MADEEEYGFDLDDLAAAASQDFDNYKTIERWANMNARGECADGGGGFPPTPFPDPPRSPARLAGEMMEVATAESAVTRLAGEMMEISTQEAASARVAGEMMEVSTQEAASARLAGEMMEVAIIVP